MKKILNGISHLNNFLNQIFKLQTFSFSEHIYPPPISFRQLLTITITSGMACETNPQPMHFEYAAVARGKFILAQHASSSGGYDITASEVLQRLNPRDDRFTCDRNGKRVFLLHQALDGDSLNFVAVGGNNISEDIAYDFLGKLQRLFIIRNARRWQDAAAFSLQSDFSGEIARLMGSFDAGGRLREIRANLEEAQDKMRDNMQQALLRGENINELESNASSVAEASSEFGRTATSVRRRAQCRKYALWVAAALFVIVIMFLIIVTTTSGKKDKKQ